MCQFKSGAVQETKWQNGEMMLDELSVQAVSDTAVLAKVKRSNYLLGVRAKRCQDGLGPEPAWCRQGTLREYNTNNDNNNRTEAHCAVKNKNVCICTDFTNMYTPFPTVAEHVWVGSLQILHSLGYMTVLCLLHWKMQTIRLIWLCMCQNMQKGLQCDIWPQENSRVTHL